MGRIKILADGPDNFVCGNAFIFRAEAIRIDSDSYSAVSECDFGLTNSSVHHFGSTAIKQQRLGSQRGSKISGGANALAGSERGGRSIGAVIKRKRQPQGTRIIGQQLTDQPRLGSCAERFSQPDIDIWRQSRYQYLKYCPCLAGVEQIGTVRTEDWRQRSCHLHLSPVGDGPRQLPGKLRQLQAVGRKARFAQMKGNDCIAVSRNHIGPGNREQIMRRTYEFWRLNQCQCRPFRLTKWRTQLLELTANPAVEDCDCYGVCLSELKLGDPRARRVEYRPGKLFCC